MHVHKKSPRILAWIALVLVEPRIAAALPEYPGAEAKKHIGEKATVVGTVDDIGHGRRHIDLVIGGRDLSKAQLWIVVPNDATGPELDPESVRGVTIAVTGKIESSGGTPQITIKSTTQIQPRTALQTNYIGRAYDKETHGDLDGAIEDLGQAIEHQPARRNEACEHLAKLKEQRGDWPGALAAYERLIGLDPNNSNSYYVRATAKKQHGDFEGGMADYEKAAELRSSPSDYIQMANWRKEKGDITGAAAEYDKAIALCNRQIAGTAKSDPQSPLGSDPYFSRGYARELKADLDGAVADYTRAIANNPARAAMAYGARGNIRRARGDLSGAIADYQHKYQITHYPDDKQKLEQARAEAKAGAKKVVVTQPSIQTAQNEQSSNKDKGEVSPESIAAAFVQAYSGTDVDALAGLYADRVDYTNSGVISNAAVRTQAGKYFARWPVRHWSLLGTVNTVSLGTSKKKVIFSATYDASDPQTNRHASGIAQEALILASDTSGAIKIVSQKEQISKRSNGQSGESGKNTSEDANFEAAKAEYQASSHDEAARVRYVTKLADIKAQILDNYWKTHDKTVFASDLANAVEEELPKHPAPKNVDSRKLSQLLVGKWQSPRHIYVFRADGTYGVEDGDQRDKWRIDGNEYVDDVSRGPVILIDRNYFIYAEGQGIAFYRRVKDSDADPNQSSGGTAAQTEMLQEPSQAEAKRKQPVASSSPDQKPGSEPNSAEVIDIPAAQAQFGIKAGNIKVTFADGHAETITKDGNCMQPQVSAKGDVGWKQCTGFDRKGYALHEKLIIRLAGSGAKEFKPLAGLPFIEDWAFVGDDAAVVIKSRGAHGPARFVRYDLKTGRKTSEKRQGSDEETAPTWAKPLSN